MLSTKQVLDLMVWFKRRFKALPMENFGFFIEWIERYDRRTEFLAHMDDESKKVWAEVKTGDPQ